MDAVLMLIYLYSFVKAVMSLRRNHSKHTLSIFAACNLVFIFGLWFIVRDINLTDQTYSTVYLYQALLYLGIFVFGTVANFYIAHLKPKKVKKAS